MSVKFVGAEVPVFGCCHAINKRSVELVPEIDQFAELIKNFNGVADNSKNTELIEQLYSSKEVALRFEKIYQELDVLD